MLKASFTYSNALFKEAGSLPVGEKKKNTLGPPGTFCHISGGIKLVGL